MMSLWKKVKILGSGGFGQVSLWCNSATGEKLAIKKPHEHAFEDITVKNKHFERWCNEVDIMKKISHVNVVAAMELPSELNSTTNLPILAMEYCSLGDLRQILNKAENCCGMKEFEVVNILKDVSQGLAYLHSCKIIHRDLKPDNIVLQQKGTITVYKLIDLGYAKSFDQSSLSKSFVGTIQYIAPELFLGKPYTSSVDYWSFGLLAHEIITGYRPFLPGFRPSEWMKQIQNKARNIISVFETVNGDVKFSSSISKKNFMSRCFLEDIENWLQLALDWDGRTRGRDLEKNQLVIFESLNNIISKKIVKIFSLPTYETISYEVKAETDILDLRFWLKKLTDLDVNNQLLLLHNGKCLEMKGKLLNFLKTENLDRTKITIFLYNIDEIKINKFLNFVEVFDSNLSDFGNQSFTQRKLKRSCAELFYYLQCEALKCEYLIQGIKAKMDNLKEKTLAVDCIYSDIKAEWIQVENFGQFLYTSHKIDLENYIYYRKTGKLKNCELVQKWIQNVIEVNNKITELKNSYDQSEQQQLVLLAKQRYRNLENNPRIHFSYQTTFDEIVNKSKKMWEDVNDSTLGDIKSSVTRTGALSLMNSCVEETEKLITEIKCLFSKILDAEQNATKLFSHLNLFLKTLKILKLIIENTQKERQKEVWKFIDSTDTCGDTLKEEVNFLKEEKWDFQVKTQDNECSLFTVTYMNVTNNDYQSGFIKETNNQNICDTYSIINKNNWLRYRFQEVQQSFHQAIKEIAAEQWDFGFL